MSVSGDGMWQFRGYTSSFRVSSIIDYYTGKICNLHAESAQGKLCKYCKAKINTAEYEQWNETD